MAASKTNVSARLGQKGPKEQPAKVLDLRNMNSAVTSVVTSFPAKRQPVTDEEKAAVTRYDAALKELQRVNPKTSGQEAILEEAHRQLVKLGLRY